MALTPSEEKWVSIYAKIFYIKRDKEVFLAKLHTVANSNVSSPAEINSANQAMILYADSTDAIMRRLEDS